MKSILSEVIGLKQSAKANRDFQDFEDALTDLYQALELLLSELESAKKVGKTDFATDDLYIKKLAHEISDCYGMAGGIYRRQGKLEKALEMYNQGASFEQDEIFKIQDSYNLSNSIIVPILQNPLCLDEQKGKIESALKLLEEQVRGKRRDQWWAWADLGILSMLIGEVKQAERAYSRFADLGARLVDYQSSISVLGDLEKALAKSNPSIASYLEQGIRYLKTTQPERQGDQ